MKTELIKASGAIHIPHKLTLVQQQLWNILLAQAFYDLATKKIFTMTEKELLEYFPYETRHTDKLKEDLKAIMGTVVEYNILEKDVRVWGAFTMLAYAELKNGVCTWEYSSKLQELLQDPKIYSKIKLLIQQRFSSKYALFLYELCLDYVGIHEVPWLELPKFREYMGLDENEYERFNNLKLRVIQPALKEINEKSDIRVKLRTRRTDHRISHLKFLVHRDEDFLKENIVTAHKPINSEIMMGLVKLGFDYKEAFAIQQKNDDLKVFLALNYVNFGKKITNPKGYFLKALKENWAGNSKAKETI